MKKFLGLGSFILFSTLFAEEAPELLLAADSKPVTIPAPVSTPVDHKTAESKSTPASTPVDNKTTEAKKEEVATQLLPEETVETTFDISKISEAFGHMIAKNIAQVGGMLDIAQVIKGLQDSAAGKISPMTDHECAEAISAVQERIFHKQCKENLEAADRFLKQKSSEKNVVSLESGKVQYTVEKEGAGSSIETHFSPLIRYKGKYLDGTVFGASQEGEKICLDEIIPGLKSGLLGMKEGEKRTIYIHPDLAYGTNGYLPPNSLLTFEIELLQANSPDARELDIVTPHPAKDPAGEVAGEEHLR